MVEQGVSAREAGRKRQSFRLASDYVLQKFYELRKDPANKGFKDSLLMDLARDRVRANLGTREQEKYFDEALVEVKATLARLAAYRPVIDGAPGNPVEGRKLFEEGLAIFKNPIGSLGNQFGSSEPSPFEDYVLSRVALQNLMAKGQNSANGTHIQEHLNVIEDPAVAAALKKANISELALVRNVMMHDLGKEYDQLPADFRAFLEDIFPKPTTGPDTNYLNRVILSHEFGSMVMADQKRLGRMAGLGASQIARVQALHSHHNAGYNPELPGFHFWVQPFAWGNFAKAMKARGIDVPERYDAVRSVNDGVAPETIVLTAIDRATSFTLASQEKFAPVLVNSRRWNNQGLSEQMANGAAPGNVTAEYKDVLSKLKPDQRAVLEPALDAYFKPAITQLNSLSAELAKMGKGEGKYSDRPPTTDLVLETGVLYRTKEGNWYRVDSDGSIYTSKRGQAWALDTVASPAVGQKGDAVGTLFRKVIFPDVGFKPAVLTAPRVITEFPNLGG